MAEAHSMLLLKNSIRLFPPNLCRPHRIPQLLRWTSGTSSPRGTPWARGGAEDRSDAAAMLSCAPHSPGKAQKIVDEEMGWDPRQGHCMGALLHDEKTFPQFTFLLIHCTCLVERLSDAFLGGDDIAFGSIVAGP